MCSVEQPSQAGTPALQSIQVFNLCLKKKKGKECIIHLLVTLQNSSTKQKTRLTRTALSKNMHSATVKGFDEGQNSMAIHRWCWIYSTRNYQTWLVFFVSSINGRVSQINSTASLSITLSFTTISGGQGLEKKEGEGIIMQPLCLINQRNVTIMKALVQLGIFVQRRTNRTQHFEALRPHLTLKIKLAIRHPTTWSRWTTISKVMSELRDSLQHLSDLRLCLGCSERNINILPPTNLISWVLSLTRRRGRKYIPELHSSSSNIISNISAAVWMILEN